jgi:hypothetical protein
MQTELMEFLVEQIPKLLKELSELNAGTSQTTNGLSPK